MVDKAHVSGKFVLVEKGSVLLVQYREKDETGFHYNLPGGKAKPEETLHECCQRKSIEETGAEIEVGDLLFVYEYIGKNHDYVFGDKHSVSVVFSAKLKGNSRPNFEAASLKDEIQTGVSWVAIEDLPNVRLLPQMQYELMSIIGDDAGIKKRYFGDIL